MCFSAAGSFTLSGVLAAVGVASVVRNSSKPHGMLAAVPLVFAAQQFAEGIGVGSIAAVWSALLLLSRHPVAEIAGHSIRYEYPHTTNAVLSVVMLAAYIAPTIGPFFVSTWRAARVIGSTLIVSLALSVVIEREALASVWCFFAAILSVQILFALKREASPAL